MVSVGYFGGSCVSYYTNINTTQVQTTEIQVTISYDDTSDSVTVLQLQACVFYTGQSILRNST